MLHIRFHNLRHTAATNMHQLTGDFYTVGEVLEHTLTGIGASLGLSITLKPLPPVMCSCGFAALYEAKIIVEIDRLFCYIL